MPTPPVLQQLNRPDCEPQGFGAVLRQPPICPIAWTQDGTEMLLGRLGRQGECGRNAFAWSWWVTGAIHATERRSAGCDEVLQRKGVGVVRGSCNPRIVVSRGFESRTWHRAANGWPHWQRRCL